MSTPVTEKPAATPVAPPLPKRTGVDRETVDRPVIDSAERLRRVSEVAALTLLALLAGTGILLGLFYEPGVGAYRSVVELQEVVRFGAFFRALHHFAASAIIVAAVAWLIAALASSWFDRVPRLVWWASLGVFGFVVVQGYSGYILPFDQTGYWGAVVGQQVGNSAADAIAPWVGPSMAEVARWPGEVLFGGASIGAHTTLRFDRWHTLLVPLLIVGALVFLARHRRATTDVVHGAPPSTPRRADGLTEAIAIAAIVVAIPVLLAAIFDAPLGGPADPRFSDNPSKPLWYFRGLQELVYGSTLVGGVVFPAVLAGGLFALPLTPAKPTAQGDESTDAIRVGSTMGKSVAWAAVITPLAVAIGECIPSTGWLGPATRPPVVLLCGFGGYAAWVARTRSSRLGLCALVTMQLTALALLALFVTFHRGPDWELFALPWGWGLR